MPNAPKTTIRPVRLDDELWSELGQLADQLGTDRSAVLRQLAQRWVRQQRRKLERSASASASVFGHQP